MGKLKEQLLDIELDHAIKADPSLRDDYENIIRARQLSRTLPCDHRNEISADAVYIADRVVKNLWIVLVVLPALMGLLAVAIYSIK
jgi:hypothetical protein